MLLKYTPTVTGSNALTNGYTKEIALVWDTETKNSWLYNDTQLTLTSGDLPSASSSG